jgi:hypothetical protein
MPGPPPKPEGQRRRRNAPIANSTRLPAAGRRGKAPAWPLSRAIELSIGRRESALWTRLWKKPQAVAWEQLDCLDAVARYVRLSVQADVFGAQATLLAEVRQMEDRLGLTPMSMLRLRWEIVDEDEPAAVEPQGENVLSIRERLAAVDN